jgi:hypothetical protein
MVAPILLLKVPTLEQRDLLNVGRVLDKLRREVK